MKRQRPDPGFVEPRASTSLADVARAAPSPGPKPPAADRPPRPDRKAPADLSGRAPRWGRRDPPASDDDAAAERTDPRERKRPRPSPLAMAVAMQARREHSKAEIVRKLMEREVSEADAQAAADRLEAEGLQSDQRFLESRVRIKRSAGHGPRRARMELSRHGLAEEDVDAAVDAAPDGWMAAAYDLVERRYGPPPLARELRPKAFATLLRRGFTYDQARTAIETPRDPEAG